MTKNSNRMDILKLLKDPPFIYAKNKQIVSGYLDNRYISKW